MYSDMAERIAEWGNSKGFYTPEQISGMVVDEMSQHELGMLSVADLVLGKLMLIVTEWGEYLCAPTRENEGEELADTAIRILHIFGAIGLDPDTAKQLGHEYNPKIVKSLSWRDLFVVHISEAAEAVRHHNEGEFSMALGRALTCVEKVAMERRVELPLEIEKKMAYNETRPIRYGKKTLL